MIPALLPHLTGLCEQSLCVPKGDWEDFKKGCRVENKLSMEEKMTSLVTPPLAYGILMSHGGTSPLSLNRHGFHAPRIQSDFCFRGLFPSSIFSVPGELKLINSSVLRSSHFGREM